MVELKELQKKVYENKVNHGWNVTDVPKEFCLLYGEVGEAFEAHIKGKADFGEELADVAIYLMGIAEITGIDLEKEILRKITINSNRVYNPDGTKYLKYDEVLEGKHYANDDEMRAEKKFHLSRVMWAFVNSQLETIISEKDQVRWLNHQFCIDEKEFENVTRGHMKIDDKDGNKARIVCYRGIKHSPVELTDSELEKLLTFCFEEFKVSKIEVWSGVKVGKIGEVWEPIQFIGEYEKSDLN